MGIRLEIANKNTTPVDIVVYRSDTEIDRADLPEPIGEVLQATGDPVIYNDNTVMQGNTYYYVFETIGPKDRAYSRNFKVQALETRGPGESDLKFGNRNLGYYTNFTAGTLIDSATLCSMVGLTGHTVIAYGFWYKFARNGKVYFVPNTPAAKGGMSFDKLDALGLVDGKVITIGAFRYVCRLMSGWDDTKPLDPEVPLNVLTDMDKYLDNRCEFNDFIYCMSKWTPLGQRMSGIYQQTAAAISGSVSTVCKDREPGKFVRRFSTPISENRAGLTGMYYDDTPSVVNAALAFYPVLELIED